MKTNENELALISKSLAEIAKLRDKIIVIKIGGSTLGSRDTSFEDIANLSKLGIKIVVVHGGGPAIGNLLSKIGHSTTFINGLRVTDELTMDVVVMTLAGKINKQIVSVISKYGANACGISGVDCGLLIGETKSEELGLVGEVTKVNPEIIHTLLRANIIPVIAPIALDENLNSLNINADTSAAEIAISLQSQYLIFLTDIEGIKNRNGEVLSVLNKNQINQLINDNVISGGMIPKTEACLRVAENKAKALIIDGRYPRSLLKAIISNDPSGTLIVHS